MAQRSAQIPTVGARVPALDGIRGLAVTAVLLFHANLLANQQASLDKAIGTVLAFGWVGVDVFFVLSGFLITGILIDSRHEPGYFSRFYARRALRIMPVYYALLIVLFVAAIVVYPPSWSETVLRPQAWYWSYLTNWWFARSNGRALFNSGHLWSLAIEEQFYLVWPLIVISATRSSTRMLRWVCGAIVVASPVARWLLLRNGFGPYTIYLATFTRLDGLAAGAWLACFAREFTGGLGALRAFARWAAPIAACGAIGVAAMQHSPEALAPAMLVVGLTLVTCAAAAWIVLICTDEPHAFHSRVLSHPFLRRLGTHSYAIYLVHYPLMLLLRETGSTWLDAVPRIGVSDLPRQIVLVVSLAAATYAVARLTWFLIELPMLRLKRFVPYAWETGPAEG
jgi:peptidoglycan/LPS O-acetylase OafA/YrhL